MNYRKTLFLSLVITVFSTVLLAVDHPVVTNEDLRRGAEDIGRVAAEARDTGLDIADQAVDLAEDVSEAFTEGYREGKRRP